MKTYLIKYINRSGKKKIEINSTLELFDDKLELNGFIKKQVKKKNEDGKEFLVIEKENIKDVGLYSDIDSVKRVIPYLEIGFTLAIIVVALYLVLNTSNVWYQIAGGLIIAYSLFDSYLRYLVYLKSFSVFYKNMIRYDLIFKTKIEADEAFQEINKVISNIINTEEK